MNAEDMGELIEVLEGRAASYRMFARLFLSPMTQADVDSFAAMGLERQAAEMGEEGGRLAQGFNDMGRGLHRRHSGTQRLLSTDFTMCFDGVSAWEGQRAVPYASCYIGKLSGDKAELFQEPRRLDRAAYRAERIEADPSLNLPDDHLSFELSFMADLSQRAADALRAGDAKEARRLMAVSLDFRANHILTWYGQFFELAMKIVDTRFYRGVLEAAYGYLELDGDTIVEACEALQR